MKKCIIIGGGIAGLSAAVHLIKSDHEIILYESSPKLGGRAYSFVDKSTDDYVDNGQHILMGCYKNTFEFFNIIGASDNFEFQKNLSVNFVHKKFGIARLKAVTNFYPFNLFAGILSYKHISFAERLGVVKTISSLIFQLPDKSISIREWLLESNQSEQSIKYFWEILAVGTLNSGIDEASAKMFGIVLREMFLRGNKSSKIVLPKYDLSNSYVKAAAEYITTNGGKICLSAPVESLNSVREKITSIKTDEGLEKDFDFVVSTVPPYKFQKLVAHENDLLKIPSFDYSTILTVHLWLKENLFKEKFYGLLDSDIHWVFNKGGHITTVTSNAGRFNDWSNEQIFSHFNCEMEKYFSFYKANSVTNYKIIKEKRATFIPSPGMNRPDRKNYFDNLILAGDWTNTGLPSTIEGAVLSGKKAAQLVIG